MFQITENEIQGLAYHLWEMRGRANGFALADWMTAKYFLAFKQAYGQGLIYSFDAAHPVHLGNREAKVCRFCERKSPATKFSNTSHAVPEFLGNKAVYSHYECDDCNHQFGNQLEHHLGAFTAPMRTLVGIKGKRGLPKYKTTSQESSIQEIGNTMHINVGKADEDTLVQIDHTSNEVTLNLSTNAFVPRAAFKAFVKIALMIMPEPELQSCSALIKWIKNPNHDEDSFSSRYLIYHTFWPIPIRRDGAICLFKRRTGNFPVPYMTMLIASPHVTYQIPLVVPAMDSHLAGTDLQVPLYPVGMGAPYIRGEPHISVFDLTSTAIETQKFCATIQAFGPIPPRTSPPNGSK